MHVIDMIFFWADMEPSRPAIMLPDRMLTYRGLADAIEAISSRITDRNLDKQAPIAVSIGNEAKFLATCFAALRLGFDVAPAMPSLFPRSQWNQDRHHRAGIHTRPQRGSVR
jgi:non-ribosomal peptide synthetase component E (peptide arylation enzyme)